MPFDLGDTVRLAAESRDAGGTLTNATTVALTITLPDGATTSPSVTNPPAVTGQYTVDYPTVQAGRHGVRWAFTPASAYTDAFDVRGAAPPLILSLADGKSHLNITSSTHDVELRAWIETTTECVEHFVGPVVRRTVVEDHNWLPVGGAQAIALHTTPAISLSSMMAIRTGGTSYDVADLDLDGATGIVQRKDGGRLCGPLRLTYTAGLTGAIPAPITAAARVILQHLWRTQHPSGSGRPQLGADDYAVTEPIAGIGYAIPNRALHLLERYRLPPGVA